MSILILSTPIAGASEDHDEVVAARLELLIARLVAKQVSGQIGYWAAFADERGVSHFAFTTDPAYAASHPRTPPVGPEQSPPSCVLSRGTAPSWNRVAPGSVAGRRRA